MWFFSKIWAEFWDFLDTRQNYGIMIAKAIIMVPTLPPKRQERHFAGRRKPVETQRVFHSIMIAKPIIMVPTLPPKRQERHFAGRRKPVETQRVFHSIMFAKPIIMVPTLPPKRQGRHFAGRRKPVETQRVFYSIMIDETNYDGSVTETPQYQVNCGGTASAVERSPLEPVG